MNGSMVKRLILKDCQINWPLVVLSLAGGALALLLFNSSIGVQPEDENFPGLIAIIAFFVALIILGSLLPMSNIVGERRKQTLPFVMSLPVSAMEYTAAKILATVGMYFVPWLALVVGAVSIISRTIVPDGMIPLTLALASLPLVALCLVVGVAIVSESEGWTGFALAGCNVSYSFVWLLMTRYPALFRDAGSPVAVWAGPVVTLLVVEYAAIALILGLTFYFQTRKTDFI